MAVKIEENDGVVLATIMIDEEEKRGFQAAGASKLEALTNLTYAMTSSSLESEKLLPLLDEVREEAEKERKATENVAVAESTAFSEEKKEIEQSLDNSNIEATATGPNVVPSRTKSGSKVEK